MTLEAIAATLGLSMIKKKKESAIEPFVRTLAVADIEHSQAMIRLANATRELAGLSIQESLNKRKPDDA